MKRVLEAFLNDDVFRAWAIGKALNPFKKSRQLVASKPDFLSSSGLNIFNNLKTNPCFPPFQKLQQKDGEDFVIFTPSKEIIYKASEAKNFFQNTELLKGIKDGEDREAIFRFSGLFQSLCRRNGFSICDDELILSWCHSSFDDPSAQDSYTISERIYHICAYLSLTDAYNRWALDQYQLVTNKMAREAKYLYQNLEYYGEEFTGNHFSNNGKALLWLAVATGNKKVFRAGHAIMENEISRLFRDGLFIEGSAHYHFLIIRNYLEAYLLTKNSSFDLNFEDFEKIVESGLNHCRTLALSKSKVPNIGDMSPDCLPEWLISIKDLNLSSIELGEMEELNDYLSLFGFKNLENLKLESGLVADEFCTLRMGSYSAVIHKNPKGYSPIPGHSHCDTGTYCLSKEDEVLVWDRGRLSYGSEVDNGANVHFSIVVDGISPDFREKRVYDESLISRFKHHTIDFSHRIEPEKEVCLLKTNYHNKVLVERSYELKGTGLLELIKVNGQGKKPVSFVFYASEGAKINCSEDLVKTEAEVFPSYGRKLKAFEYSFSQNVNLPFEIKLEIN